MLSLLSLSLAYKLALEQLDTLTLQESKIKQLEEKIIQAKGQVYPSLKLNGYYAYQDVPARSKYEHNLSTVKLTATQPLFHGFREFHFLKLNQLERDVQIKNADYLKLNVYWQTAQSYYSILIVESDLNNLQEQLQLVELRIKELKERVSVGRSKRSDLLAAESQRDLVLAQIEAQKTQVTISKENLSYLTGIAIDKMQLENPVNEKTAAAAATAATAAATDIDYYLKKIDGRSDIQTQKIAIESSEVSLLNIKSLHYPTIDFTTNYYLYKKENSAYPKWDVGLYLTFNLYEGGVITSQVAEAVEKNHERKIIHAQSKRQAEREIKLAYSKLINAKEQLAAIGKGMVAQEKAYKELLKDYSNGQASNLDVLQSQNTLLEAKKNYQRTRYQNALAKIELQVVTGQLE